MPEEGRGRAGGPGGGAPQLGSGTVGEEGEKWRHSKNQPGKPERAEAGKCALADVTKQISAQPAATVHPPLHPPDH